VGASGGKVSHLESWLPFRFTLRSSGQIAMAFAAGCVRDQSWWCFGHRNKFIEIAGTVPWL